MDRIKNLSIFQKVVLGLSVGLIVLFSVLYPVTISRKGILYRDAILVPKEEGGETVYSGKMGKRKVSFTVRGGDTVECRIGDKTYGPYVARPDETAAPSIPGLSLNLTGVVLSCGGETVFRGGIGEFGGSLALWNEDGTMAGTALGFDGGFQYDSQGELIQKDYDEPGVEFILTLLYKPELTNKGDALGWFTGFVICMASILSILYADELFRWNLSFQINDVEKAEPSDWELTSRALSWVLLPIFALIVFLVGLH